MHISQDHVKRINNVILYIENNLSENLSIDMLAELACFSKFHFSRIFKSVTGESVYHYIKRVRLERAAYYLWGSDNSIKNIAYICGFRTTSNFSYNYKLHFGVSAKEQREINTEVKSNSYYPDINVVVKKLPEMRLGYMKKIGDYDFNYDEMEGKLVNWATSRGEKPDKLILMGYDSIYVTKSQYLRSDLCIPVSIGIEPNDDVSIMNFPQIKVISSSVKCVSEIHNMRDKMEYWIRNSAYQTIIGVPSLIIHNNLTFKDCGNIDKEQYKTEICVPVKAK